MHHTSKAARIRDELDVPVSIWNAREKRREIMPIRWLCSCVLSLFLPGEFAQGMEDCISFLLLSFADLSYRYTGAHGSRESGLPSQGIHVL
jgi:hypothetical protein